MGSRSMTARRYEEIRRRPGEGRSLREIVEFTRFRGRVVFYFGRFRVSETSQRSATRIAQRACCQEALQVKLQ